MWNSSRLAADPAGPRVGIWGFGREGTAALRWLRASGNIHPVIVIDERTRGDAPPNPDCNPADPALGPVRVTPDPADARAACDLVLLSPGVSIYRPEVDGLRRAGVGLASPTSVWLSLPRAARVIAVTGTKGKSTTASLIHAMLTEAGVPAAIGGNIGTPPLDTTPLDTPPRSTTHVTDPDARSGAAAPGSGAVVLEISSAQCATLSAAVDLAVVTSLSPDHLDWHGSVETYYRDKLRLLEHCRGTRLVSATDPTLLAHLPQSIDYTTFGEAPGVHVAGDEFRLSTMPLAPVRTLSLPGEHNRRNACAAIAAVHALGVDLTLALSGLARFTGLPHRLETIATHAGVRYVNDSLASNPAAALAAAEAFPGEQLAMILGGLDRGVDWTEPARRLASLPNLAAVVALPENGPAIADLIADARGATPISVERAERLPQAVRAAASHLPTGGIVLLSPGAPSDHAFRDYAHRGDAFREAVSAHLDTR